MFCTNCGHRLEEGAVFCSNCGTKAVRPPEADAQEQFQFQKNAIRQSEMNALKNAIYYFSEKKDVFDEYEKELKLVNYYARGAKNGLIIWGGIISAFAVLLMASTPEALLVALLLFFLPAQAMIAGGILMKINNRRKYRYHKKRSQELFDELSAHYMQYPACPVGMQYCNPDVLVLILEILESGRADTVKESVNLLIAKANKRKYNAYLRSIDTNSGSAAVFATANLFE